MLVAPQRPDNPEPWHKPGSQRACDECTGSRKHLVDRILSPLAIAPGGGGGVLPPWFVGPRLMHVASFRSVLSLGVLLLAWSHVPLRFQPTRLSTCVRLPRFVPLAPHHSPSNVWERVRGGAGE